jgi:DNA-binding CsgD family transcriptional regulator
MKETILKQSLTQRELDVINQIIKDKTNQEIAKAMNLSYNTVVTHRKNIMKKLKLKSGIGLVLWAIENGVREEG